MKLNVNTETKKLSLAFFLIFLGFGAVHQYTTTYFAQLGVRNTGFISLILIYLFFALTNLVSPILVSKFGAKRCMIFSSPFYMLYIIIFLVKSIFLLYMTSIFLGIAASFLWTAQASYLIRVSNAKSYGTNAGFFISIFSIGPAVGILFMGLLINYFSFLPTFAAASSFPLIAFVLLFFLKDVRVEKAVNRLQLVLRTFSSTTALRLSTIWFMFHFVTGLGISIIPLQIESTLGFFYIAFLSSLRWIIPILFSYPVGKFSDIFGRKQLLVLGFVLAFLGSAAFYFSQKPFFLIIGIILFALTYSLRPISLALLGDVSSRTNLEFITAFVSIAENLGLLSAIILSTIIQAKIVYLVSMAILLLLFIVLLPVLKLPTHIVKDKLSSEV